MNILHKKICSKMYSNYAIMYNSYVYFVQNNLCIAWRGFLMRQILSEFSPKKGECASYMHAYIINFKNVYIFQMDSYPKILSLPVLIAMAMSVCFVSHPKSMFNNKCSKTTVTRASPTKFHLKFYILFPP